LLEDALHATGGKALPRFRQRYPGNEVDVRGRSSCACASAIPYTQPPDAAGCVPGCAPARAR
jgi:hypothetical protein